MPEEVRAEIEPYFLERSAIIDEDSRKLPKLDDDTADYISKGLTVSLTCHILSLICILFHISCMPLFTICSQGGVIWISISMSTMLNISGGFLRY